MQQHLPFLMQKRFGLRHLVIASFIGLAGAYMAGRQGYFESNAHVEDYADLSRVWSGQANGNAALIAQANGIHGDHSTVLAGRPIKLLARYDHGKASFSIHLQGNVAYSALSIGVPMSVSEFETIQRIVEDEINDGDLEHIAVTSTEFGSQQLIEHVHVGDYTIDLRVYENSPQESLEQENLPDII